MIDGESWAASRERIRPIIIPAGDPSLFKWRRKSEGFEWRDYVRTTILVRRKERRQRVKNMQVAAVENIKHAGKVGLDSGAAGASKAGKNLISASMTSASWLRDRGLKAIAATGPALRITGRLIAETAHRAGEALIPLPEPVAKFVRRPNVRLALNIVAAILIFAVIQQIWTAGLDLNTVVVALIAALIAVVAFLAKRAGSRRDGLSAGEMLDRLGDRIVLLPGFDRLSPRQASVLAILGVIALVGAGAWMTTVEPSPAPKTKYTTAARTEAAADTALKGRATAITGDRLKVAGTIVHLDGIEAPDADQMCDGPSGKWKCGSAAKEALSRAVRGRSISCEVTGKDETATPTARCIIGGTDVAAPLVQSGHAFAESGFFARYGGEEREAKVAKIGLWSGDAERPADYRAKRWDEAKRSAPEGCPIKGSVASGARIYVLPWSSSYDSVRVSTARGERWFCSEDEAQAAGWKPQTGSRS
jgi:endonuclease YncB( thermonuclease family)